MTYWSDHANHPRRDIWDWIGVCNTQAHSIGLNRDPAPAVGMDPVTKRLRTRLWWCLYSRDRLIAMGLRRPSQLNEGTSNVPMLKLEDFDFEPYHLSVTEMFHCRQLEDISHQKRLATMFIEKTKLCQCIGRVLFAQYSPSQCQFGTTNRTTVTLVPRQASESELGRCSQKLESWLNGLPKDAQFIPESQENIKEGEDVLLLHSAMLRMLYHATISALHRPWAMGYNKEQSKARQELTSAARAKMHDSALGITHIIQGLNQLDLTRFLPQSGVTVILPAAVAHLTNSNSDNPTIRETSLYNFQRCVQVLQGLKDIYPAADMEVANIEAAVRVQSDSVNEFLRVMQYNIGQGQSSDAQNQRSAIPPYDEIHFQTKESQTPEAKPAQTQQLHHNQQTRSNQDRKQSTASNHQPTTSSTQEDTHKPFSDLEDHFILGDNTNPIIHPDLLTLDIDIDLNNPLFPDFSPTSPPNQNNDTSSSTTCPPDPGQGYWTDDLLEYPRSGSSEGRSALGFSNVEHVTVNSMHGSGQGNAYGYSQGHRQGHTPNDITGDLDRDLGLIQ